MAELSLSDNEMNSRLIDFAESLGEAFWSRGPADLNRPMQVFKAVWELESDVNNDGFEGYFINPSAASRVPLVVEALCAIGASRTADIVRRAIEVSGWSQPWRDEATWQSHVLALQPEALEALDQEFFAYPDNLTVLLYRYACAHRAEIGFPFAPDTECAP